MLAPWSGGLMPDDSGKFTKDDVIKMVTWFTDHKIDWRHCSVCGQERIAISENLVATPILGGKGGLQLGGTTYPHVMTLCRNCGHERLFNAVVMGLMPASPATPEKPDG